MIWSIPSSKEEILTNTPLGAKSVRYLYFENKNGGFFAYKSMPDSISISIDGKQICRNLVMLPFCTGTPEGTRRFSWQDIALEVPININNSEVRISGVRNNDFDIVFVLSEDAVEENRGFDYYESRVLQYKALRSIDDPLRAEMHTNIINAQSGQEHMFTLEYEPLGFFAYNIVLDTDIISSDFPRAIGKLKYQPHFLLNLSASDNEDITSNLNLALVSCTDHIPHSKAYWEFPNQPTHKTISVKVQTLGEDENDNIIDLCGTTTNENGETEYIDKINLCLQTILFFKSKQLV